MYNCMWYVSAFIKDAGCEGCNACSYEHAELNFYIRVL